MYRSCLSGSIRLCGSLVVKVKGTDGLVNRLYKKNSPWNGIYNVKTKRREWNNIFCTYRLCMSCGIMTAYDVVIMYDPLTAIHYESSSVPFVDWFFSNSIEHDQIPQLETKFILMTRYQIDIASMQFVIDCLSCFFLLVAHWLERRSSNKEKRKNKMKIRQRESKEKTKKENLLHLFHILKTSWSFK